MEIGLYFEEYPDDWTFETEWAPVTDEAIRTFVDLCGFNTPTYKDPAYIKKSYGGRMAPGMLVMSLAEGLMLNAGLTRRRAIFVLELTPKFKKPVYAGNAIMNRIRFKSKRVTSKGDRGVVVTDHEVVTDKGEVAIVYEAARMIRMRSYVEAQDG